MIQESNDYVFRDRRRKYYYPTLLTELIAINFHLSIIYHHGKYADLKKWNTSLDRVEKYTLYYKRYQQVTNEFMRPLIRWDLGT